MEQTDIWDQLTTDGVEAAKKLAEEKRLESQVDKSIKKSEIKETKFKKNEISRPKLAVKDNPVENLKVYNAREELQKKQKEKANRHKKNEVKRQALRLHSNELFAKQLKSIKLPNETDPLEIWEATLDLIKTELNSERAIEQLYGILNVAATGMEMIVRMRPDIFPEVRLSHPISFSQVVQSEKFKEMTIKEATQLSIEYDKWLCQSAGTRMLMAFYRCAVEVNVANQNAIGLIKKQEVAPATQPQTATEVKKEPEMEEPLIKRRTKAKK